MAALAADLGVRRTWNRRATEMQQEGMRMFEPLPEKPPHMAGKWIMLIGCLGGGVGVAIGAFFFGEEAFQSNVVLFGCAGVGILAGVAVGWKLIMPSARHSGEPLE
jgi:hypothetical protein